MSFKVKLVGEIAKLDIKPGGILVLTTPQELTNEQKTIFIRQLERMLGFQVSVICLVASSKLEVLQPSADTELIVEREPVAV